MTPFERHLFRKQYKLTPIGEVILDIVRMNHDARVMKIMTHAINNGVATHATVHAELTKLIKAGYVELKSSMSDRRAKDCLLTIKGKRLLEKL